MKVLLVATYELGQQPLAIAAPAGVLRERGHDIRCIDLAIDQWDPALAAWADRVVFSVPMHTATRLAREVAATLHGPVACVGLYAHMCADVATPLVSLDPVAAIVEWIEGRHEPFAPALPARDLLPPLDGYAHLLVDGERRIVATAAATLGCAHHCRHCPVPVVYDGRVRRLDAEMVQADLAQQVSAGAQHVTFTDPDFLNAPPHARRVVQAMHAAFPDLTFDCTVRVEHVLRHRDLWAELADAGCLFVVSAFESVNDTILARIDKGHTALDAAEAVGVLRAHGIEVHPSWMPFTPWTQHHDIVDILDFVAAHDLVANVDPVQYTIRLLVPEGSLLIGRIDGLGPWDPERLSYPWTSADPTLDALQAELGARVEAAVTAERPLAETYASIRAACGAPPISLGPLPDRPRLSEPWFCCAEPTSTQTLHLKAV